MVANLEGKGGSQKFAYIRREQVKRRNDSNFQVLKSGNVYTEPSFEIIRKKELIKFRTTRNQAGVRKKHEEILLQQ